MARIEKTVFISYRRTDVYTALAVYENLKNQGYDVFFDYRSIASGDFEQVISTNIKARAHFLLILTPTALDRCNEPGDWLRREIELAIDEKRNIVPLFFKGFRFGGPTKSGISKWIPFGKPDVLIGKLANLNRYNGLNVHEDYFDEAMVRLRDEYLSKPLETVLHPVSTEVQKVVEEEQHAADEAIKQKEDKKESVKPVEEKPDRQAELETLKSQALRLELKGDFWDALQIYYKIKKLDSAFPRVDIKIRELERELQPKPAKEELAAERGVASQAQQKAIPWRLVAGMASGILLIALCIWGSLVTFSKIVNDSATNTPSLSIFSSSTSVPMDLISDLATQTAIARWTITPSVTLTKIPTETFTVAPTATFSKTPNVAETQFIKSAEIKINEYFEKGYLTTIKNGRLSELRDGTYDLARINSVTNYSTGINNQIKNFAVWVHVKWDISLDGPEDAGCGIGFRYQNNVLDGYSVILTKKKLLVLYCSEVTRTCPKISPTRGSGVVDFNYPAEADLELIVNNEHAYILINKELVGEYTLSTSNLTDPGYLKYAVLSSTNKDYGTRCEFTNGAVWEVIP